MAPYYTEKGAPRRIDVAHNYCHPHLRSDITCCRGSCQFWYTPPLEPPCLPLLSLFLGRKDRVSGEGISELDVDSHRVPALGLSPHTLCCAPYESACRVVNEAK